MTTGLKNWRKKYPMKNCDTNSELKNMHYIQGGVHKIRLQDLSFFYHLPPSVYIFYGIKVNFFDHLPPSSCKRSLWTAPCWICLSLVSWFRLNECTFTFKCISRCILNQFFFKWKIIFFFSNILISLIYLISLIAYAHSKKRLTINYDATFDWKFVLQQQHQ